MNHKRIQLGSGNISEAEADAVMAAEEAVTRYQEDPATATEDQTFKMMRTAILANKDQPVEDEE